METKNPSEIFYHAVSTGDVSQVISLLDQKDIDVNWSNPQDHSKTSLHAATDLEDSVLVAMLLGKGADILLRDDKGRTPLMLALDNRNTKIASLLANKTISSLEEAKKRSPATSNGDKYRGSGPSITPEQYARLYKIPDEDSIDANEISSKLDAVFQAGPHPKSLFRVHIPRQSAITTLLTITHFQTIYNIFVAIFMIYFVNILLHNYVENGQPLRFDLFWWVFGGFHKAIGLWCLMFVGSFSAFFLQRGIVSGYLRPKVAYSLFVAIGVILFLVPPFFIRALWNLPPASSFVITTETCRLFMKMHSYLSVNYALDKAKKNKDDDPAVSEYPGNITFGNYWMYLWFPTLVYQPSYPRTKERDWGFVFKRFGEVLLCVLYVYAVYDRYCVPVVDEMNKDLFSLTLGIFKVMIPGIGVSFLAFFLLLHCWMNAFAELTRFADRHFYSDWWNSTNWAMYYRKWNFVVHHYIHRHIFLECMLTFKMRKTTAMILTFLISAIIHEYAVAIALGFYKPILFIMFMFPGVLFIPLTKSYKGSRGWNVFMWAMLIVGHGMLFGLYARAWHFNYNVPNYVAPFLSYFWII